MKVTEVLRACDKLEMRIREGRDTFAFFWCGERLVLWSSATGRMVSQSVWSFSTLPSDDSFVLARSV